MGKEKEFDNILDECLDRLFLRGETVDECLRDYPVYEEELKPLLEASLVTGKVSLLEPDPEFKAKARNEMFAYLSEAEEKRNRAFFRFSWQPRWAAVVSIAVALLLATGGTAAASTGSMPDDFLYPVKLATEQVQLAFTFTSLGKAEAYARMANRRVEEIVYLANENKTEEIDLVAVNLDMSLNNIAVYSYNSENLAKTTATEGYLQTTESMATRVFEDEGAVIGEATATADLPALEEETPVTVAGAGTTEEDDSDGEEAPDAMIMAVPAPAASLEVSPTEITGEPESPDKSADKRTWLNISVTEQANKNIQQLRELLEIVPESVKPIIEKAIEMAEYGYGLAIESLNN